MLNCPLMLGDILKEMTSAELVALERIVFDLRYEKQKREVIEMRMNLQVTDNA
jgi:hypothetical protein